MNIYNKWSEEEIKQLLELRESGKTFVEISAKLSKQLGIPVSPLAVKKAFYRYRDTDLESADIVDALKSSHRAKISKSKIIKENKLLVDNILSKEEFLTLLNECLKNNPIKIHKPIKHKSAKKKSKRTIVAHISDTHFQAQIDEEEMGGINRYTSIEEARRLAFFIREVANYKVHYRNETDLVVVLNGDNLQGIIHNQESTPLMTTQVAAALHLLSQAISFLAQQFKSVKVVCMVGNHSRYTHKENKGRQTAQKWDSFDTILHIALRYALKQHTNIEFEIPTTPYAYFDIQGHKFFATHSDTVISSGNVGVTISTKNIKDKINDLITGIGKIDVCMIGHVHCNTYATLNNGVDLLINGTMSGVDPFAQSIGIFKNNPSQQLFEVTDNYAVGDLRSVRLEQADKMIELDEIIKPFEGKF